MRPTGLSVSIALFLSAVIANSAEPERVWRPFPDTPEILFYEDFESDKTAVQQGAVSTEKANSGKHSFKCTMTDWGRNDKIVWAQLMLSNTPAKIPGPLNPANVHLQFSIWTDEPGFIEIKFIHNQGEEFHKTSVKVGAWDTVTLRLGDMRAGINRIPIGAVSDKCEFFFHPIHKTKVPTVYIDDIIFTNDLAPAVVLPRIQTNLKKAAAVNRSVADAGFQYTLSGNNMLKAAAKIHAPARKRTIVVASARASESAALAAALNALSKDEKLNEFVFAAATAADDAPLNGLDEVRAFLPHNLHKYDAEMVVLVLSANDATGPGAAASAGVSADRALAMGCIPIVCLPIIPESAKDQVTSFNATVAGVCAQSGAVWVDQGFALKGLKSALENNELSAEGIHALAKLAVRTIKHVSESLAMK